MGQVGVDGAPKKGDLHAEGVWRHGRRVAGSNTEGGPMARTGRERSGDVHHVEMAWHDKEKGMCCMYCRTEAHDTRGWQRRQ